jgi:hypothetical protein
MKKLIIASLAVAAATTMYGQGLVNFTTTGGRVSYATVADGSSLVVGSFLGSDMIGAVMNEGVEIGRANFGMSGTGKPTGRLADPVKAIDGLTAGATYTFTLEAFNAAYEAADKSMLVAGGPDGIYYGVSAPFSYKTGIAGSINPDDAAGLMSVENFGVNAYSVVPEPTTIALGILGLSSLLLFRRRD